MGPIIEMDENAIIPVTLEIIGKGTLGPNTVISWPLEEDFNSLIDSKKDGISSMPRNKVRPCEPLKSDEKEARKELKSNHVSEQKNLRRKCQNIKKKILSIKAAVDIQ